MVKEKQCIWEADPFRGGASPEKVGWKRDRIDGQKVYLTILTSFLLRNEYRPEDSGLDISGVDMSTPIHPVAPPLDPLKVCYGCKVLPVQCIRGPRNTSKSCTFLSMYYRKLGRAEQIQIDECCAHEKPSHCWACVRKFRKACILFVRN